MSLMSIHTIIIFCVLAPPQLNVAGCNSSYSQCSVRTVPAEVTKLNGFHGVDLFNSNLLLGGLGRRDWSMSAGPYEELQGRRMRWIILLRIKVKPVYLHDWVSECMQLSELGHHGESENGQTSKGQQRGIRTRTLSIATPTFYRWTTILHWEFGMVIFYLIRPVLPYH